MPNQEAKKAFVEPTVTRQDSLVKATLVIAGASGLLGSS